MVELNNLRRLIKGLYRRRLGRKNSTRIAKALGTVMHALGLGGTAKGFYIPYRYADQIKPLSPDEQIPWLKDDWDTKLLQIEDLISLLSKYNGDLASLEKRQAGMGNKARFSQDWFSGLDAASAYGLVRLYKPRTIIEVGSGHSTRFMYRAAQDEGISPQIFSIDPVPRKNIDGLCTRIFRTTAEKVEEDFYLQLEPGDILFIDGSHVAMSGTDVDYLLGRVLPRIKSGVLVHVHDVFLPNGYPDNPDWRWWSYNEQYMLLPLLYPKGPAELLFASAYVRRHQPGLAALLHAPNPKGAKESSLWLKMR
jgi:predicted O-methyltransferase YrrM